MIRKITWIAKDYTSDPTKLQNLGEFPTRKEARLAGAMVFIKYREYKEK